MKRKPWVRPDIREMRAGAAEELIVHVATVTFKAPHNNRFNDDRIIAGVKDGTRIREPFEVVSCEVIAYEREEGK